MPPAGLGALASPSMCRRSRQLVIVVVFFFFFVFSASCPFLAVVSMTLQVSVSPPTVSVIPFETLLALVKPLWSAISSLSRP